MLAHQTTNEITRGGAPALAADSPRIYAACLAAYNNGVLHGRWIDADQDAEDIQEEINAMLAASPIPSAEEWAFHDYEGFGKADIGEFENVERIAALAEFIGEHGEDLGGAVLDHYAGDLDAARAAFQDYGGCFSSLSDFAYSLTEDTQTVPQNLAPYVDYDSMARDMETNGDIFSVETGFEEVHIFWTR